MPRATLTSNGESEVQLHSSSEALGAFLNLVYCFPDCRLWPRIVAGVSEKLRHRLIGLHEACIEVTRGLYFVWIHSGRHCHERVCRECRERRAATERRQAHDCEKRAVAETTAGPKLVIEMAAPSWATVGSSIWRPALVSTRWACSLWAPSRPPKRNGRAGLRDTIGLDGKVGHQGAWSAAEICCCVQSKNKRARTR